MNDLLPCPFCGGDAEIVHIEDGENAGGRCVCCTRCMASGNVDFGRKENFVANWNRRALPAASQPEVEPVAWLVHKAGRGWYRPDAQGYTNNPAEAGRYSYKDAYRHAHPNGPSGPTDGITIKPVGEVLPTPAPVVPAEGLGEAIARAMCKKDGADWDAPSCNFTANGEEPEEQREYWLDKAEAALAALRSAPPVGTRVKPLVWEAGGGGNDWRSETSIGVFAVNDFDGFPEDTLTTRLSRLDGTHEWFSSADNAKAAAQADYEARILSARDGGGVTVQEAARALLDQLQYSAEAGFLDAMQQVMPTEQTADLYAGLTAALAALLPAGEGE